MSETKFEEVVETENMEQTENTQETQNETVAEDESIKQEVKNYGLMHKLLHPQGVKGWLVTGTVFASGVALVAFGGKKIVNKIVTKKSNETLMQAVACGFGSDIDKKAADAGMKAMKEVLTNEGIRILDDSGEALNEIADEAVKGTVKVLEDKVIDF